MFGIVFPGQGSQYKGMGGTLFDEFADLTREADAILGYSIKELCLNDPNYQLHKTQYTQPALYVVNALSYYQKMKIEKRKPDYLAGHSLGEYNALLAAGVFDFETGLKLVKKRGELMMQAPSGGMAAVIGLDIETVENVLNENDLTRIDIANHNAPSQIVIAGLKNDIESAQEIFERTGAKMYIPLEVSGAFHSRYMSGIQQEFEVFLRGFEFSNISIPVISNVDAYPYKANDIKTKLVKQITQRVQWNDTIRYFMGLSNLQIEEVGPKKVLTNLIDKIKKEATPLEFVGDFREKLCEEQDKSLSSCNLDITVTKLGSPEFKSEFGLTYSYVVGAMYRGIASEEMVIRAGRAGMLGFYGTGGLSLERIEKAIRFIQNELIEGEAYGFNLLHNPSNYTLEYNTVNLFLKYGINKIEASAYMNITPALVMYRGKGLKRNLNGEIEINNKIIAKVSRPEVAEVFLSPAPTYIVEKLVQENKLTRYEADLLQEVSMADALTVEADSGGHTDLGAAYALMPTMIRLRDRAFTKYGNTKKIRIGAAGGIGTPEAAAAAFMLGADYIVTGSINQCTVEAGTSDIVKDLLQQANVQDTDYAPAGDLFELGAKVQVLKKGLFFPARSNKLYDLYRQYNSLDEIDEKNKKAIEEKYFKKSFDEIYQNLKENRPSHEIAKAEKNPKYKMALVFRWYFGYSSYQALSGNQENKVDFQIHCGSAIGAFNQWVKGTPLENWRNRHVDEIGIKLMTETAELLRERFQSLVC